MNETKSKHLWLNVTLIALETFSFFILTHDATLRLQAQKLIKKNHDQDKQLHPFL